MRGGDLVAVGADFSPDYNRSMGQAMEVWNAHRWRDAVDLFTAIYTEQPASPWAGEAELHVACYLKYNARYDEAEDRFLSVLTKYPDQSGIRKKVLHYLPHLYALTGRTRAAQDALNLLQKYPMGWQEAQYYENYSRIHHQLAQSEDRDRLCGGKAVAFALACRSAPKGDLSGITVEQVLNDPLANKQSENPDGFSLAELAALAGGSARRISFQELQRIAQPTNPAIVYFSPPTEPKFYGVLGLTPTGAYRQPSGHFVAVRMADEERVLIGDPQFNTEYSMEACDFEYRWQGYAILLSGHPPVGTAVNSTESRQLRGGCCGSPPPDPTGGRCYAANTGRGRNGPGDGVEGPGGGLGICAGCSFRGFGSPAYQFGLPNQNLLLFDTPMWYPPAKGPGMAISLVYNRVNTFNLASNATANYYAFGNKWSFNYNIFLKETPNNDVQLVMEDGRMLEYERKWNGTYEPKDPRDRNSFAVTGAYYRLTLDGSRTELLFPTNGLATNGQQVVTIRDRFGNEVNCHHDSQGRLTNVVDALQRSFSLTYNGDGYVTNIGDVSGRYCVFAYSNGNLVSMTDMAGYETILQYDWHHWITNIVYPNDSALKFSYATGYELPYPYDAYPEYGNPAFRMRVEDALGRDKVYFYHAFDIMGPVTVRDEANNNWVYGVKRVPNTKEYIDTEGVEAIPQIGSTPYYVAGKQWVHRQYSLLDGDLTRIAVATGTHAVALGMELDGVYTDTHFERRFKYDANHWATSESWYTGGVVYATWSNVYDTAGNLLKHITPLTGTLGFGYDSEDNLIAFTNVLGEITRFSYNSDGCLAAVTNARGYGVEFGWSNGLLTAAHLADSAFITMTYDNIGRRTTVRDPFGYVVSNAYDDLDRLEHLSFPDGSSLDFQYSCCGLELVRDRLGRETHFAYDILSRLTGISNAMGHRVELGYGPVDNVTNLTVYANGTPRTTRFGYSSENGFTRVTSRISPMGKTSAYGYTFRGWPTSYTDGHGESSTYSYDAIGRLTRVSYSATANVDVAYDTLSRIASITDPVATNTFVYDAQGRVLTNTVSFSVPGLSHVAYGLAFQYDAVGNATNRLLTGLTEFTNTLATAFAYDSMNRLLSVSDAYAAVSYTFSTGRLTAKTYGNGDVTRWDYDAESRPIGMTTSNGVAAVQGWQYGYDKMGMITSITDMATNCWTYEYDAVYRLTREVLNGTNSTLWEYDEIGNRITRTGETGARSSAYNADNEIAWISDDPSAQLTVTGAVEPGPASNKWYNTWATVKGQTARVSTNDGTFAVPGIPLTEGPNALLVTVRDVTGNTASQSVTFIKNAVTKTETFGYDRNGNLTAVTSATAVVQYAYDRENRLIQVSSNGAPILECWYDGIGRRMAKREVVDGVTNESLYVYDGWDVLAVLNGQGDLREVYTRGLGLAGDIGTIVAETKFANATATNTYYYHGNHRGDVTTIRSTNGTTVATFDYRPYGELRSSTGETVSRYRFSSKELDSSVGLYYYGRRHYSPGLGRWIEQDPLLEAGGINLYAFTVNNPVNYIDPDGRLADIILDLAFIAYDVYRLGADGSCNQGENWRALGMDVAGFVIPFATGLGVVSRTGRYADDVYDLAKGAKSANIKVIGRLDDTAVAKGWAGHDVLDIPNWTPQKNMQWIDQGLANKQPFYTASPQAGNMVQTIGPFKGQPTIYAQELQRIQNAGYIQVGDYYVHPDMIGTFKP